MSQRLDWNREVRIFSFCIDQARQIIGELQTSHGEHQEDIEELEGLIEVWEHLQAVAQEAILNERQAR